MNTDFVENEKDFLGLITPEYQVLSDKISELHLEISWRVQSKMQERGARRLGKERPAVGPMTPEMFFDIIGPPPPGREAYSQNRYVRRSCLNVNTYFLFQGLDRDSE
jgi:hypothetical protein